MTYLNHLKTAIIYNVISLAKIKLNKTAHLWRCYFYKITYPPEYLVTVRLKLVSKYLTKRLN